MRGERFMKIFFLALAVLIILFLVLLQYFTSSELRKFFGRTEYLEDPTRVTVYKDNEHYQAREPVSFLSGDNRLQGFIYGSENNKGLIVVAHGIGAGHESYIDEIIWFVGRDWRVFAYDATGSCESEGAGTRGLPQSALDLDHALSFIAEDPDLGTLPVYLFGHSWGGYAVTAVLNYDHDVTASASLAAYSEPMEMMETFVKGMEGVPTRIIYPFIWLDTYFRFGKNMNLSAYEGVNTSEIPVLIVHGKEDTLIPFNGAALIAKHDKITNPYVEFLPISRLGLSGHDSIFHAVETNKPLVHNVNEELMLKIESFFEEASDE